MRKINIKAVVQYVIVLGLGIGLIWYNSTRLPPQQLEYLKSAWSLARYEYLIPVLGALLLSHYSRALRWMMLMKPLGYTPSKINTYFAVLLGYFFNMLMPRLGEVMKCTVLAKYEKVAPDKLVGTILVERAVDMISMGIVAIIMVAIQFDRIGGFAFDAFADMIRNKEGATSYTKLFVILGILLVLIIGLRYLFVKKADSKLVQNIKRIARGVWEGFKSIRKVENLPLFIFHSVFIWSLYLFGIWIGFMAFPPVEHLGFPAALSVLIFGSIGLIATPGGIGAYEFMVEKTLVRFDIPNVVGLAFGRLNWAAQTAITLVSGLFALIVMPIVNRNKE